MKKSSSKFNELVDLFSSLPTIGRKSAFKIAYYLLFEDNFKAVKLSHLVDEAVREVKKCEICGNITEDEICYICADEERDARRLCVVASAKDIFSIELSGGYDGRYFVFEELKASIVDRLEECVRNGVEEVIFAFTPSVESDGLIVYLEDKLSVYDVGFTKIAHGVPTGVSFENIDTVSLARAIESRVKA
ncbi:MAG: recombination mediator RecR [Campylobacterales bacterium]|nr:recombination mediator RecR [Campylobacterales bacterium]